MNLPVIRYHLYCDMDGAMSTEGRGLYKVVQLTTEMTVAVQSLLVVPVIELIHSKLQAPKL